jgi:uncharacterized membrane protein
MSGEFWAILSAATWAVDSILVRKGTVYSNATTAALTSFVISALVFVTYIFLIAAYPAEQVFHPANLYFVVSGLIQPAFVRVLFYMGIVRLGVARAGPLRSTAPLFTVILAFFLLHEMPGLVVYAGAFLTVAGTWFVSYKRPGEARWRKLDLLFPIGAAILASISQNIRKLGLNVTGAPLLASTVSITTSLLCLTTSLMVTGKISSLDFNRKCMPYFVSAGFFASLGQLFTFMALHAGEVSVVAPLGNTTPLFIIAYSAVFLRGEEKLTMPVVLGAALLVGGIALITSR